MEQLKMSRKQLMQAVKLGDLLFHGDAETEKRMGVTLSKTGMACAMCHPWASDTHPYEFPKFSEQIGRVATFREMVNWCIEKPNEGATARPRVRRDARRWRRTSTGRRRARSSTPAGTDARPAPVPSTRVLCHRRRGFAGSRPPGGGTIRPPPGGQGHAVVLRAPIVAGNGNKVPLVVEMAHPMEAEHYIRSIEVTNARDPIPSKGVFQLTPANGQVYLAFQARMDEGVGEIGVTVECSVHGRSSKQLSSITIPDGRGGCAGREPVARRAR